MAGDDRMYGEAGNDVLFGEFGDDYTSPGAPANDYLSAGEGNDVVFGSTGSDQLYGGGGLDQLDAGPHVDYVNITPAQVVNPGYPAEGLQRRCGRDLRRFGSGFHSGGLGNYQIYGLRRARSGDLSDGGDDIWGSVSTLRRVICPILDLWAVRAMISSRVARQVATPGANILNGNSGDDLILGAKGPDYVRAGDGNDEIHGLDGDDILYGDNGDDLIDGAAGSDTCNGDNGTDQTFNCEFGIAVEMFNP